MRVVVVGGGISGLAAAWVAAHAEPAPEVVVLERAGVPGGKAVTHTEDGWRVECGPTGYLAPDAGVDRLLAETGVGADAVPADEASAHRFVVRGGRMREVAAHPLKFARSGILGPLGLLRVLGEPFVSARAEDAGDESVWGFARRRIGRQAADRLVAPMVLGVFAGDARRLSLAAAFPRLAELERAHGSLVRGMIAGRRRTRSAGGGPTGPRGRLTSLREGMGSLSLALAGGPFEVRCNVTVEALERRDAGWALRAGGDWLEADGVVLAVEAFTASRLLATVAPEAAAELEGIAYPPVAVVGLGYEESAWAAVPAGFGVLIPRGGVCAPSASCGRATSSPADRPRAIACCAPWSVVPSIPRRLWPPTTRCTGWWRRRRGVCSASKRRRCSATCGAGGAPSRSTSWVTVAGWPASRQAWPACRGWSWPATRYTASPSGRRWSRVSPPPSVASRRCAEAASSPRGDRLKR